MASLNYPVLFTCVRTGETVNDAKTGEKRGEIVKLASLVSLNMS